MVESETKGSHGLSRAGAEELADTMLSAGFTRTRDPRRGSLENRRLALERLVTIFEFFHNVAPDRGWAERAAEWRSYARMVGP